jgi:glycine/D-amino acid oxidase-like deaminating enzyme
MRRYLERRLGELWPAFKGVETTHFWRGLVSLTRRRTPAIGRLPEDPTVFFAYGCHGNGVNTMPWAGQAIARLIRGANRDEDLLPGILRGPAPRFPLPALRRWYLKGAYLMYRLKER